MGVLSGPEKGACRPGSDGKTSPNPVVVASRRTLSVDPIARYTARVTDFQTPIDLTYNRGLIADPAAFANDANAASWLYLCGEEFAAMEGGMSYAEVEAAVPESVNIVSDPPRVLDMNLARQHVAALDALPRPTLVTCRVGPRSSALVYLYAGLRSGATPADVLARAEADNAPFTGFDDLKAWVVQGLAELS
jgi:hypothetical protein